MVGEEGLGAKSILGESWLNERMAAEPSSGEILSPGHPVPGSRELVKPT